MSADIAEILAKSPLFADLAPPDLNRVAEAMRSRYVAAGETLVSQGEVASSLFLVVSGRLRASVRDERGVERPVGEIGAGEMAGEMSLLSEAPRSATVRAVRDTRLLELPSEAFTALVLDHPKTLLEVTRILVTRLERSIHARSSDGGLHAIAVVPAGESQGHRALARRLAETLAQHGSVELVDAARIDADLGNGSAESAAGQPEAAAVTEWLYAVELATDRVVLVSDATASNWTRRCLRGADRVLLVAGTGDRTALNPAEQLIDGGNEIRAHVDLVVVQPDSTVLPSGTAAWRRGRTLRRIHHVRDGYSAGMARLGRVLSGRSVGLVLSGGGARGFAHIGVLKALQEAGIHIDHVGGASFGATVAGLLATDIDIPAIIEALKEVTIAQGSLLDITAPAIAVARGHKLSRGIQSAAGDAHIEDLWIDFFCVSADLTAGELRVHDSGPAWLAIRASVAIPGTFPPVRASDGHVLVDGGVMNNFPLDVLHARGDAGLALGVDLRAGIDLPSADLSESGVVSGWKVLSRRLNPWAESLEVPGMMDILLRVTEIASGDHEHLADVMFRPPVEQFKILDFKAYPAIIEAGYRHALDVLEESAIR